MFFALQSCETGGFLEIGVRNQEHGACPGTRRRFAPADSFASGFVPSDTAAGTWPDNANTAIIVNITPSP